MSLKQRKHKGLQRMLAMLFAVVMVVTSVPQTAMGAYAAETGFLETVSSIETVSEMTEGAEEESGAEEVELISEEAKTEEITSEEFETESTTTQEVMPEEEMIQEVTSELEEIWVEETVLRPSIQAEGNGDDGSVSVNDVYTFTFVPDEHVTIYDEDGINEITELTVPVGSGDEMYFTVKMDEGYTVQSVRHNIDKTYLLHNKQKIKRIISLH